MDNVTDALQALEARIGALEDENTRLRAQVGTTTEPAAAERAVSRRGLLRWGGTAAAAATGAVLLRPAAAGATPGPASLLLGTTNDAGADGTILDSSTSDITFDVGNTGTGVALRAHNSDSANTNDAAQIEHAGAGRAVYVNASNASNTDMALLVEHDGLGEAISGWVNNAASGAAAVKGTSNGTGPTIWGRATATGVAVRGEATGPGRALEALVSDPNNTHICVYARHDGFGEVVHAFLTNAITPASATWSHTRGTGAGVEGVSDRGEGGRFSGKTAQVRLVPSAGHHPASGEAGQLFVDVSNNLWFCKGGTSWTQLA